MMKPTRSWTTGLGLKSLATLLLSTLLMSCGSSKKYDEFMPTRILSIGDAMSYMSFSAGEATNTLTSVDPATGKPNHWLTVLGAKYGRYSVGDSPSNAYDIVFINNSNYRMGLASPCNTSPNSAWPSRCSLGTYDDIEAQANKLFQLIPDPRSGDLVVMTIGMGDVFELADTAFGRGDDASSSTELNAAKSVGVKYINLADRLYQHGFKHVLLLYGIDQSKTPYATTKSLKYRENLANLTKSLNNGVNINCKGGCSEGDNKPYSSRAEGVWRAGDIYAYLLNITNGTSVNLRANINNNTIPNTSTSPLCLFPSTLSSCTPNGLNDSSGLPYFFSGDLYLTPTLHSIVGNFIYNFARSNAGF